MATVTSSRVVKCGDFCTTSTCFTAVTGMTLTVECVCGGLFMASTFNGHRGSAANDLTYLRFLDGCTGIGGGYVEQDANFPNRQWVTGLSYTGTQCGQTLLIQMRVCSGTGVYGATNNNVGQFEIFEVSA